MERQIEVLAPAGSMEALRAAISAGADAIYIGGTRFGARAYAQNLETEDMLSAIDYVHLHGKKIYMTVNTLLKDREIAELYDYIKPYYEQGLDAVIVQDVGVLKCIRTWFPDMAVHVSTQMTVTGALGASFFKDYGVTRIVPARELSLEEIRLMKDETNLEIECFVHGALCYCYSGQCLLSSMIGGRSGNRGQCAQPCRLPYGVNGDKPADVMSLKDLCTIEMIPELIEAGIDSFKIEGRMKQPYYVYTVVSMYSKYVDMYLKSGKDSFCVSKQDKETLEGAFQRRGYTKGYYKQHNSKDMISLKRPDNEVERGEGTFPDRKISITGKVQLEVGSAAILELECGGVHISHSGAEVQEAQNKPLTEDRVYQQIQKMGNTEFEFERLDVEIEGNVFLPMQALNELRRTAVTMLEDALLDSHKRVATGDDKLPLDSSAVAKKETTHEDKSPNEQEEKVTSVLVSTKEQLTAVLDTSFVNRIYVDDDIAFDRDVMEMLGQVKDDKEAFVTMPYIFRTKGIQYFEKMYQMMVDAFDGVLIRNIESLKWLRDKGYNKIIVADDTIYIFNQVAKDFIIDTEVNEYHTPAELNFRELQGLGVQSAHLQAYGYHPVMMTANCITQTTSGCKHKEGFQFITDRYKKKFAVKNCCKYCYNIIYNSQPLFLMDQSKDLKELNPRGLRMDFTVENAGETKEILNMYERAILAGEEIEPGNMDFTRGHFRRGVK